MLLRDHTGRTLSILGHILGIFAGGCLSGQGIGVEIYDTESQCLLRGY